MLKLKKLRGKLNKAAKLIYVYLYLIYHFYAGSNFQTFISISNNITSHSS